MTLQEKELLTRFLDQLKGAQAGAKDGEAEALIRDACARQPDASYLLVQRAIQLEQLLAASQAEAQKLKAELESAQSGSPGGSFLNDSYAWGRQAATSSAPIPGTRQSATSSAPIPGTRQAVGSPPMTAAAPNAQRGSWGSGLFGNIAATAAGVVAGSFLFQGIQGLMNRNDTNTAAAEHVPQELASNEPELLNSFDTPEDGGEDTFASGFDDSGDFA
ncbi:MAG: DUF2076 domain-containing protein [Burkholderiales bacterium]